MKDLKNEMTLKQFNEVQKILATSLGAIKQNDYASVVDIEKKIQIYNVVYNDKITIDSIKSIEDWEQNYEAKVQEIVNFTMTKMLKNIPTSS